jgi:hypothetical protein
VGLGIVCWLRSSGICSPKSYEAGPIVAFLRLVPFPRGALFVRFDFSPSVACFHHVFEKEGLSCGLLHQEGSPILCGL